MTQPKILTFDIETAPMESYHWGLWDQNIGIDFVNVDWSILSYAAKWGDSNKIIYADTGGRGKRRVRDDKPLMKGLRTLLDEADIVVAQNGKKFDVRKVNARLIEHGFSPPSPYRVIDTMVEARKYFAFSSQKLKWTSERLTSTPKDDHKKFPGFELWKECLNDNPAAWAEMKKYNFCDVRATWEVYKRLRPWIENHPNLGVFIDAAKPVCPKCGGKKFINGGYRVTQATKYARLQCMKCGGWSRGKMMLSPIEKRRSLLLPE